jgi:transposase
MARQILKDELWNKIEPLLPPEKPKGSNGRPPIPNREAFTAIVFVLKTGIPWEDLPQEMGCGCGMSAWRRLQKWQELGVWKKLHESFLNELGKEGHIDWKNFLIDASSVPAPKGGPKPVPTRRIERKPGLNATLSRMRKEFRLQFA